MVGTDQRDGEVSALCDGAATLSKLGNRIAALALLWAAVGIAPTHLRAHRNLAAALANNGDVDAAAEEFARYVEFMLKAGEYQRAALELVYANSSLGSHPALVKVGRELIPLGAIADALSLPAAPATPALEAPRQIPAQPVVPATPATAAEPYTVEALIDRTPLLGLSMRSARLAAAGLMTALATVTLSNVLSLVALAAR
jgi:tetratricopeptide (TPR) repeat protein